MSHRASITPHVVAGVTPPKCPRIVPSNSADRSWLRSSQSEKQEISPSACMPSKDQHPRSDAATTAPCVLFAVARLPSPPGILTQDTHDEQTTLSSPPRTSNQCKSVLAYPRKRLFDSVHPVALRSGIETGCGPASGICGRTDTDFTGKYSPLEGAPCILLYPRYSPRIER